MDSIFFERQEAALCAQHALNMLLQGPYFSPIELSEIAHRLDREENGVLEANAQNAISVNMNESGYFSVQVISEALKPFALELTSIDHPTAADVKANPLASKAFICNMQEHWFTLRKFGAQWFCLNSVKAGPELLSDTYLGLYLHQLRTEGYSIFVVRGILPDCEADHLIALCPVQAPPPAAQTSKEKKKDGGMGIGRRLGTMMDTVVNSVMGPPPTVNDDEDRQLAEALALSVSDSDHDQHTSNEGGPGVNADDDELKRALQLSLQATNDQDIEEQDRLMQIALMKSMDQSESVQVRDVPIRRIESGAEAALAEPVPVGGETELDRVRRQREAFLNRFN